MNTQKMRILETWKLTQINRGDLLKQHARSTTLPYCLPIFLMTTFPGLNEPVEILTTIVNCMLMKFWLDLKFQKNISKPTYGDI
ncbi:MAG: hypothetical protein WC827_04715 [Candidatus Paceibacterota bacterium]